MPGSNYPVIGCLKEFMKFGDVLKASDVPLPHAIKWIFDNFISNNGIYDSTKNKAVLVNVFGTVILNICDPEMT